MSEPVVEVSWTLRAANPEDEVFLEVLFSRLHAGDFAGLTLPPDQLRGLIQMQARAQRMSYLRDFPAAQSSIVMVDAVPAGRLLVDYRDDSIHLVDIALLPERQGCGIGKKILLDLQTEARNRLVPLRLNVQPGNPALQLYNRLGFQVVSGGMHLGMQWSPDDLDTAGPEPPVTQVADEQAVVPARGEEDPATVFPGLVGRRFHAQHTSTELTLDRVHHHRALAKASFSLFFRGPLEPVLAQATQNLQLLDDDNQPEREFFLFLVAVGPEADGMEYEAVFNL